MCNKHVWPAVVVISVALVVFDVIALVTQAIVLRVDVTVDSGVLDLGKISQRPFSCTFRVRNTGNRAISFGPPRTGCDCTSLDIPIQELPSGAFVDLKAQYAGGQKGGPFRSQIFLPYHSESYSRQVCLEATANVIPHLSIVPAAAQIDCTSCEGVEFAVKSLYEPEVRITRVHCTHSLVAVSFTETEKGSFLIRVKPTPIQGVTRKWASPAIPATISIHTTSEWMPYLQVPLTLRLRRAAENIDNNSPAVAIKD